LAERKENGTVYFRGGAGGAPCAGGFFGLWTPSLLITLPAAMLILFFGGYASVATMSLRSIDYYFCLSSNYWRFTLAIHPLWCSCRNFTYLGVKTEINVCSREMNAW
jgi:glycerol-3-phosphate acyltransferase PlsY